MALIPTQLAWPWVLPAVAAAVVVLLGWWARRPRRAPHAPVLVAHAAALRSLPRYQRLARRRRRTGLLLVAGALLFVAGAAFLVARPQTLETSPRDSRARDLMLCLDASKSMDDDNATVVRELRAIVGQLHDDRVGMMIWSSAGVLIFPLTDDYDYVGAQLRRAERAFTGKPRGFYDGVDLPGVGASLLGDGIVSCARRFDGPAGARTRVLLVTSDNDPIGSPPLYSLPDAARYAAEHRVLVYGIGAASLAAPERRAAKQEFADVSARTGGVFTVAGQADGTQVIGRRIQDLARAHDPQLPRTTALDTPYLGASVSALGLLLLAGGWAGQRRRVQ
jgi:Ca-activated chloride channel family protein